MSDLTFVVLIAIWILVTAGQSVRDRVKNRAMVHYNGDCICIVHNSYEMIAFRIDGPNRDFIEPVRRSDIPKICSWRHDYEVVAEEIVLSFDQRNDVRSLFPEEASCWDRRKADGLLSLTTSFAIQMSSKEGTQIAIFVAGCDRIRLVKESGAAMGGIMLDSAQVGRCNAICKELWSFV